MLVLVAFVAPILPALTTVAGAENETRASWIVWAIGTVPGLAIAAAGASRPRTARVVAGVAIFELLATAIGYFVVYIAAGGGA